MKQGMKLETAAEEKAAKGTAAEKKATLSAATAWPRRTLLKGLATVLAVLPLKSLGLRAEAEYVPQPPPEFGFEERLTAVLKGRQPTRERVTLTMPELAEDGSVVPVTITVASPMTTADHVRTLYLLAVQNPDPLIFSMTTGPDLGGAEWKFKIRMRATSIVLAIAEMNDGRLYEDRTEVAVTLSGCG